MGMLLISDWKFFQNYAWKIAQILLGDIHYYDFRK